MALIAAYGSDGWESRVHGTEDPALPRCVTLVSPEVSLSRQALLELLEVMLIAAYETGCQFDGFQVAVPVEADRPWWKLW